MPTMELGGLLEPGLRNEASQVYRPIYSGVRSKIGECVWLEATSDKLQEVFGFLEAPTYFTWWPAETPIPSGNIKSQRFTIINRDFGRRNYLPRNSDDDQTGTAMQFARMIAETYAILPEEIFYQIITGTSFNGTTAPLPASSYNVADGNGIYSTGTRYGSSSGNVVSVTSTSTVQGVITDTFSVVRRFQEFQNTQGRPFFDATATRTMSIFHGTATTLVMNQAEFQTRVPWEVTSGANGTGQTPTNVMREAGLSITYVPSQRITDSKYYCFLRGLPTYLRPIWRQVRKGYTEWQGNFVTSDHSRDTGQLYVQGDCREGYGGALAIGTIRVS